MHSVIWFGLGQSRPYFRSSIEAADDHSAIRGALLAITKAMLMDDELALVGSLNLDIRSLQLNFELDQIALVWAHDSAQGSRRRWNRYFEPGCHAVDLEAMPAARPAARMMGGLMFFY